MTTKITVTTQEELDAALKEHARDWETVITIDAPRGVWIKVECGERNFATVRAYGNSTVRAYGNSTVEAYGNSTVEAYGNSTVDAYGNSTVRADGNSTVRAYGNSTVRAYGNSTVEAYGNSTVEAYGNSTVEAYGNSTVEAYGNSTVEADGNSTVRAYGNSTVRAYGNSTVEAGRFVAVHLFSATVKLQGGVLIDMTQVDLTDPEMWCEWAGAERRGKNVVLFKAVGDDLYAGLSYIRTHYPVGKTVKASDWRDDNECGGGLHLSPHIHQALAYNLGAKRFLECEVALADLRPIVDGGPAKAKMPKVKVIREVDRYGKPLPE